ncbi:hypothetical protein AAE478_010438 [Parahypoxylon ruwenzoriense]
MKSLLTKLRRPSVVHTSHSASEGDPKPDIVSRLPFELHTLILIHLEPEDIDAGLGACRRWRGIWLSEEIWPKLADRWFPGMKDHIRKSALDGQDTGEMFRQAVHKIQRRLSGRFASALHSEMRLDSDQFALKKSVPVKEGGVHSYDDVEGLEPELGQHFPHFRMYNNGRIAWWPEVHLLPYFAVVDDLRTRERRAYLFPNHRKETQGYGTAMSDKLLLMGRGRTLHAWHLEKDRLCTVEVPEEFVRCCAEGETVLVLSRNAELYLWKFGQELQNIHIEDIGRFKKGRIELRLDTHLISEENIVRRASTSLVENNIALDFIVSPTENNVFFVITFNQRPQYEIRVHEIRNGELAGTYELDESEWADPIMSLRATDFHREKSDSYGGYRLFQARFEHNQTNDPNTTRGESACGIMKGSFRSVCFNIYTKSFTILHFHTVPLHGALSPCQIWNGRMTINEVNNEQDPVISLRPCTGIPDSPSESGSAPLYTTVPSGRGDLSRRQRVPPERHWFKTNSTNTDFALDPCQQFFGGLAESNGLGLPKLACDDEFIILVTEPSYVAWSFDGEIPESTANGQRSLWRSLIR